jgi:hypothetical protein
MNRMRAKEREEEREKEKGDLDSLQFFQCHRRLLRLKSLSLLRERDDKERVILINPIHTPDTIGKTLGFGCCVFRFFEFVAIFS